MIIAYASVFVDDQQKALDFYTTKLGFQLRTDVPSGTYRWLTVVPPDAPDGVQLLLEPSEHPAVHPFERVLVADGIPCNGFGVEDVRVEDVRLTGLGVRFVQKPTPMGPVATAVLDDTCGNPVMIAGTNAPEAAAGQ